MAALITHSLDDTVAQALIQSDNFGKGNDSVNRIGEVTRALLVGIENVDKIAQAVGGYSVATKAALTALTKADLALTVTALGDLAPFFSVVVESDADGLPRRYRWHPTSGQTASQTCLATDEGSTGRWFAMDTRAIADVQTALAAAAARVTATDAKTAYGVLGGILPASPPVGTRIRGKALFKLASTNGTDTCEPTVELGTIVLAVRAAEDLANDDIVSLSWDYIVSVTGASGKLTGSHTVQLAGAAEVNTPVVDLSADLSAALTVTPKVTHSSANAGNQTDLRYLESEITY